MPLVLQIGMTVLLFLAGLAMLIGGLWIVLTREYQETMRALSAQSGRITGKSLLEANIEPALIGASQLIDSVTRMVQTALGTGVFLCILGTLLCTVSLWLSTLIR